MSFTRQPREPQSGSGPLTEDLRRMLRTELLRDTCYADEIARHFSMHRRTMHRRLSMEGHAFRQIANEIRFEIARELLERTQMPLGQIAAALRYSELSAFTRAFRRWSGQTPTVWRTTHPPVRKTQRRRGPLGEPPSPHPMTAPVGQTDVPNPVSRKIRGCEP